MTIIDNAPAAVILNPDPAVDALADRLAWVNDDASNTMADYPGPSWGAESFIPDPWAEAFYTAFTLALGGEDPAIPAGLPGYEARAYEAGVVAGRRLAEEREEQDEREYNAWLDDLAREREAELMLEDARAWHEAERVEAIGSIESRKG